MLRAIFHSLIHKIYSKEQFDELGTNLSRGILGDFFGAFCALLQNTAKYIAVALLKLAQMENWRAFTACALVRRNALHPGNSVAARYHGDYISSLNIS